MTARSREPSTVKKSIAAFSQAHDIISISGESSCETGIDVWPDHHRNSGTATSDSYEGLHAWWKFLRDEGNGGMRLFVLFGVSSNRSTCGDVVQNKLPEHSVPAEV